MPLRIKIFQSIPYCCQKRYTMLYSNLNRIIYWVIYQLEWNHVTNRWFYREIVRQNLKQQKTLCDTINHTKQTFIIYVNV